MEIRIEDAITEYCKQINNIMTLKGHLSSYQCLKMKFVIQAYDILKKNDANDKISQLSQWLNICISTYPQSQDLLGIILLLLKKGANLNLLCYNPISDTETSALQIVNQKNPPCYIKLKSYFKTSEKNKPLPVK